MAEKLLTDFFKSENIKYYSCLPLQDLKLLYPEKLPQFTKSVCFFLIPYYFGGKEKRNVSLYAVPRDYHPYAKELEKRLSDIKEHLGTELQFKFFADNSPFAERTCAEMSGLGDIGKNGLLINPEYGSYVFIGSICLSTDISISHRAENFKCDLCESCEKCKKACPARLPDSLRQQTIAESACLPLWQADGASPQAQKVENLQSAGVRVCPSGHPNCLSNITQKKIITDAEREIIAKSSIKWGCDICQTVCPYNKNVSDTPIEFFRKKQLPFVTEEILLSMSKQEFSERAYSWRGKKIILRNVLL